MLVKWATALTRCTSFGWPSGNGAPHGLGDARRKRLHAAQRITYETTDTGLGWYHFHHFKAHVALVR